MLKFRILLLAISFAHLLQAQHKETGHSANKHMHKRSVSQLIEEFESEGRKSWQKPEEVIQFIGPVEGKKIIDIGAGSGYFSFALVRDGAYVIAADVNDEFQRFISSRKKELGISNQVLEVRKIPYNSPGIKQGEVDMAIIVNTYHHIEGRQAYFADLKEKMRNGGQLVVIDFIDKETPVGPPLDYRLSKGDVLPELAEAGFTHFEVNLSLLPYQYIIIASQ
ncbi:MAG: methyltransferase domain-containing protein [Bacteroidota bacterium]